MANALARVKDVNTGPDGPVLYLNVIYSGPDVGVMYLADIEVPLVGTESATQLRTLLSAAVANWPSTQGFIWTVPGTGMLLPVFQKG